MSLISTLRAFGRDRKGASALMFAALAVPSVVAVGAAIDLGRAQAAGVRLASALDSAALAMGAVPGASEEELLEIAEDYVAANFAPALGTVSDLAFTENEETGFVALSAKATIDTSFLHLAGMPTLSVQRYAEVRRAESALMVALVLDNTGSMWAKQNGVANIEALRSASLTLVSQLFGDEQTPANLRVSVVPYAAAVNVGSAAEAIVANGHGLGSVTATNLLGWKGCVLERSGANSIADTTTASGGFWTPYRYPNDSDNRWDPADARSVEPGGNRDSNGFRSPNLGCPTPILPLTNDRDKVEGALSGMTAWNRGGTLSDIGVAWGLRTLSPQAPFSESQENDPQTGKSLWESVRWRRAIVIMTDGESQFFKMTGTQNPTNTPAANGYVRPPNTAVASHLTDYTGYGRLGDAHATDILGTNIQSAARDKLNQRIEQLCTRAKQEQIVVYTVVFTSGVGQSVRDMYERCASDPGKYWYAPSQSSLESAFSQIGRDLVRLHLSQ